ncbi:DUF1428 domain-containing protein (plasmid) [Falsihalocynthiibacter sp. SS001]|uniref:DUF1428 domain-containing protein n=1 Tax=Falsihalocynthiibacter sp. SS001 TaxID=3349698 RepID=UPI0036D39FFB
MSYVDGFIAAVPNSNKEKYIKHAKESAVVFKEYGATSVIENWGDDVNDGELTSFPMAVKCKEDETVVFSWVVWPSRKARDEAWEKIMGDSRMSMAEMPFDGKRLIYGGFETVLEG